MQAPREGAGLTNLDGILYCVGGYDGNHVLNSIERYDPRIGQWTGLAPMTSRRSGRFYNYQRTKSYMMKLPYQTKVFKIVIVKLDQAFLPRVKFELF